MFSNQCGCSIGTLRSDNGGEYLSEEFNVYLQCKRINHELSVPYSPAQNRVAERFNQMLMESPRSMMVQAALSKCYWAEAKEPSTSLKSKTPYER